MDVGGKVDPHKQPLLEACSHYVLVSREPEAMPLWHEFCRDRGNLQCVAILHTQPPPTPDLGEAQVLEYQPDLEIRWDPTAALPVALLNEVQSLIRAGQ